jgi:aspartokinase
MRIADKSPTADVYAGDTASLIISADAPAAAIHFFKIEADAEPGTFARIANVMNIANVAPICVILKQQEMSTTLNIYIELRVVRDTAGSIHRKLAQLVDVTRADIGVLSTDGG